MTIEQALKLGMGHHQSGRLLEAEAVYRQMLSIMPDHPDALHLLGVVCSASERPEEALALICRAIAVRADAPGYYCNLGHVLTQLGRYDDAIVALKQALTLRPDFAEAHYNLGIALRDKGDPALALETFQRAASIRPDYPEALFESGNALSIVGNTDAAIAAYRQALAMHPDYAECYNNLAAAFELRGDRAKAADALRNAVRLRPDSQEAWLGLGQALGELDDLDGAISAYRRSLALKANCADTFNALGTALRRKGMTQQAIEAYQRAVELTPNSEAAHYNLGAMLLLTGDFARGWAEHEWRLQADEVKRSMAPLPQPAWDESDLKGLRILLRPEQGLGDAIQFVRYVPMIRDRGGKVILVSPSELVRLFRTLDGVEECITAGDPLRPFDVHSPLMSLPYFFKTSFNSIPAAVPYLHPEPAKVVRWRQRLSDFGSDLKVGLVWAGAPEHADDRHRSMVAEVLAPLEEFEGVQLISLQVRNGTVKQGADQFLTSMIDWTDEFRDFSDTAALVANLDLVISVDTAVAHLTGAMGKPVWLLLPYAPDWRWMLGRTDSPWYPTMRLFRQKGIDDWAAVISEIVVALEEFKTVSKNGRRSQ